MSLGMPGHGLSAGLAASAVLSHLPHHLLQFTQTFKPPPWESLSGSSSVKVKWI